MQEIEQKRKKKKKLQTTVLQDQLISEAGQELLEFLQEQEAQKSYVDIQICPKCKSPKIKRANSEADPGGNMGLDQPKYECRDCGYNTRIMLKATNRPMSVKDVELILEAQEAAKK